MVERKENGHDLLRYFQGQKKEIIRAFLQYREESEKIFGKTLSSLFNPDRRWLSEMPLCGATFQIKLPEGLAVVAGEKGRVFLKDFFQGRLMNQAHVFAHDGNGTVLCFTPGQFVGFPFSDEDFGRGKRIAYLCSRAPDLIHIVDDGLGVAFLYGTKDEVAKKLGLIYVINGEEQEP